MEYSWQIFEKMRKKRKNELTAPLLPRGLEIYFYQPESSPVLYPKGQYSAEDLCTEAAKWLGITPLCNNLFALYDEESKLWYAPNHSFDIDENTHLRLHYRMRFYFTNWHGAKKNLPAVCRHVLKRTGSSATALLDMASLKYLFSQAQYDFLKDKSPWRSTQSEEDVQHIENECLGMAVIAISYQAMDQKVDIHQLTKKNGYKNYIPESLRCSISKRNILTRLRIASIFDKFLEDFNRKIVRGNNVSAYELMVKYILIMETLNQNFGCELFEPVSLHTPESQETDKEPAGLHQVLVTGTSGIKYRKKPTEIAAPAWTTQGTRKSKRSKKNNRSQQPVTTSHAKEEAWTAFSDFHEITHIVIKDATVTVYKQENTKLELTLAEHAQALSFASLVDGYFRLTADAHHFLCTDVAPVSVEMRLRDGCHGPINSEYATQKLKDEGNEVGMYVLRSSSTDYDHILLTVLCSEGFKNFQIRVSGEGYRLCGTDILLPTLRALTDHLSGRCISTNYASVLLTRGCPPQPRELSNVLLQTRPDSESPPTLDSQLMFHRIHPKDIVQENHLGHGTRTNIYAARLMVRSEDEEDQMEAKPPEEVKVVLKVLGAGHKDISAFLETGSLMHQVSHKHIVLLYGICVRRMEIIMVEEFVRHGPLDLFMRAHHSSLTPTWKFQVAKQLAGALSYMEDKKFVHGYVCTKNILLARDGLDGEGSPFIKLSDPGLPITVLIREECIDRIPWIAPECVKNPSALGIAADKWAFGTTLWEICHNGEVPLKDKKRSEKEHFYEAGCTLVAPESSELAELITHCMTYDPKKRLFFRAIVRDLDSLEQQNPSMVAGITLTQEVDPTLFERRFLKKIRDLGEGHFGEVELCLYDPVGDHMGEWVAVKSLKSEGEGAKSNNLIREINTMKALQHENIVKYKGICSEEGGRTIRLVMEYLPAGSLKEYLPTRRSQINLRRLLSYAIQICQGMDYLGSQNYIHRDLAARNVLVENENIVKIGDFGLTKSIRENKDYYKVKEEQDSPAYWYAPECLIHRKFYKASDVWSFGVTLYELVTYCERRSSPPVMIQNIIGQSQHGQMTMTKLVNILEEGKRLPCPPSCPDAVYALMQRCWKHAPDNRMSFRDLIQEFEALLSAEDLRYH